MTQSVVPDEPIVPDEEPEEKPDAWLPRPFAVAKGLEPNDQDEELYADEVLAWGMAFTDHVMTYDRDPVIHFHEHGDYESTARVLRVFSRGEPRPVRLVWL